MKQPLVIEHVNAFKMLYFQFPPGAFNPSTFGAAAVTKMESTSPLDQLFFSYAVNLWNYAPDMHPLQHGPALGAAISLSRLTSAFRAAEEKRVVPIRVRKAMAYIEDRLGNPSLTPKSVADAQNISRRYLDNLFVQIGYSIESWIWERRLQRALEEISAADQVSKMRPKTMLQISMDLGFKNPSHFSRLFSSKYGVTPRAYKKQLCEQQAA